MHTPQEMFDVFVEFFRRRGTTEDFEEFVRNMDINEFDMVLGTMDKEEQAWFYDLAIDDFNEVAQYYVFLKFFNRYWDAKYERTSYDNDAEKLIFTPYSSMTEVGMTLNAYLYLKSKGLSTILDVLSYTQNTAMESIGEEYRNLCVEAAMCTYDFCVKELPELVSDWSDYEV